MLPLLPAMFPACFQWYIIVYEGFPSSAVQAQFFVRQGLCALQLGLSGGACNERSVAHLPAAKRCLLDSWHELSAFLPLY